MNRAARVIDSALRNLFRKEKTRIADHVAAEYRSRGSSVLTQHQKLAKDDDPTSPQYQAEAQAIVESLGFDSWVSVAKTLSPQLRSVARAGAKNALLTLKLDNQDIFDVVNELAADWADARAAELVGMQIDLQTGQWVTNPNPKWSITQTTRDDIHDQIVKALEDGLTPDELRDAIVNDTAFGEYRAEMIARTEVNMAQTNGHYIGWERSKLVSGVEWLLGSEHDDDDECDDNAAEGVKDMGEFFSSGDMMPPAHPNCFPEDTLFMSHVPVRVTYKRWLDGELVHIRCFNGTELSVTPNHPILTGRGWIAAGEIGKHDSLFHADTQGVMDTATALAHPDYYLMPTVAQKVAGTLLEAGGVSTRSVPSTPEQFHGDGTIEGKVYIVGSDSLLRDEDQSSRREQVSKRDFISAHVGRIGLSGLSHGDKGLFGSRSSTDSGMGVCNQGASFLKCHPAHADSVDGGQVANLQSVSHESTTNNATVDPKIAGDEVERFSAIVSLVGILHIERRPFSGHVYNLQTDCGFYFANGFVAHNCVCAIAPVLYDDHNPDKPFEGDDKGSEIK
jgi:hypothetical protein